ncbi:MAG: hypothetical protein ND895_02225 [Pyrinomonadaceae bacterium]|nr:hypothetical protein [Pyrinomonadaceae bacterium]
MKRLALSLFGGFAIPFLYTIIAGPLSRYIESPILHRLVYYPVRWPILILYRFIPFDSTLFRDQNLPALFILIVACDVILYTILTYFLLRGFSKRKGKPIDAPPNPPLFVQQ